MNCNTWTLICLLHCIGRSALVAMSTDGLGLKSSDYNDTTEEGTISKEKKEDPSFTNKVSPSFSYKMFQDYMRNEKDEVKKDREEPQVLKTFKTVIGNLIEVAYEGILKGFLPDMHRQRREAPDENKSYLDILIGIIGALMGRQECSQVIACRYTPYRTTLSPIHSHRLIYFRTGKFVGLKVPGASLVVMMLEGIIPNGLKTWFGVAKTAVIDRSDSYDCSAEYACSLVDEEIE